jgi:hypothetical protein
MEGLLFPHPHSSGGQHTEQEKYQPQVPGSDQSNEAAYIESKMILLRHEKGIV